MGSILMEIHEKRRQHACTPFRNLQQPHDTTSAQLTALWKRLVRHSCVRRHHQPL